MAKRQFMSKRRGGRNSSRPATVPKPALLPDGDTESRSSTQWAHLRELIEAERARLLEVHSILLCLQAALLYAAGDDALDFADTAKACQSLVLRAADALDSSRIAGAIPDY